MSEGLGRAAVGALLHGISRILGMTASGESAFSEFLKTEAGLQDDDLLGTVAGSGDLAWIAREASRIAQMEGDGAGKENKPLEGLFNQVRGSEGPLYYSMKENSGKDTVLCPGKERTPIPEAVGKKIREEIRKACQKAFGEASDLENSCEITDQILTRLLEGLEDAVYLPSGKVGLPLYDALRASAAVAAAIQGALDGREISGDMDGFEKEEAFLLCCLNLRDQADIISDARQGADFSFARERSESLHELMNCLSEKAARKAGVPKTSAFVMDATYSFLLLPNTEKARKQFEDFLTEAEELLFSHFRTDLILTGAAIPVSSAILMNETEGSFSSLLWELFLLISEKQNKAFSLDQILRLNRAVMSPEPSENAFEMTHELEKSLTQLLESPIQKRRESAGKDLGSEQGTVMAIGEESLARCLKGQKAALLLVELDRKRLLFSDIPDLSLARSLALCRVLKDLTGKVLDQLIREKGWKVFVIRRGFGSLMLAGDFWDVLGLAVDLRGTVRKISQGVETMSAVITLFSLEDPASSLIQDAADLFDRLTGRKRDVLALGMTEEAWDFEEFESKVLGEKLNMIRGFFASLERESVSRKMYLERLLSFFQTEDEELEHGGHRTIHFARFVYLLARMEGETALPEERAQHRRFQGRLASWIGSDESRRQLKCALWLYALAVEKGDQ